MVWQWVRVTQHTVHNVWYWLSLSGFSSSHWMQSWVQPLAFQWHCSSSLECERPRQQVCFQFTLYINQAIQGLNLKSLSPNQPLSFCQTHCQRQKNKDNIFCVWQCGMHSVGNFSANSRLGSLLHCKSQTCQTFHVLEENTFDPCITHCCSKNIMQSYSNISPQCPALRKNDTIQQKPNKGEILISVQICALHTLRYSMDTLRIKSMFYTFMGKL